jgi:acyl transferase domain-containing protein
VTDPAGGVAIIGWAGRFPGAGSVDELWRNLRAGVESISAWSDEEVRAAGAPASLLGNPNLVKAGGVVAGAELFDAAFFAIPPALAQLMDPQQRLFLECAWESLEHAGYDPWRYPGAIGVYAGSGFNGYLLHHLDEIRRLARSVGQFQALLLNDKDFLALQTSYRLNLRGPSLGVQSACSTSLVAVHLACQSLLGGECDMALAGGVSINTPQGTGYLFEEGGILSPDGHCRAFAAGAQGTVPGAGAAVVVLKRLADALADGDRVQAVVKGSAVNNDGLHKAGFTAPSVDGQARVVREALAVAEVDPATVAYVETHGTGTPLGDAIELAALAQAFGAAAGETGRCALGSVKTNLGHLDVAAGVAGLIKAALALRHGELPASLYCEQPNPQLTAAASRFYANTSLAPWPGGDTPRRAGVSSFGIGGTNAHVVLEQAPAVEIPEEAPRRELLVWSARTPKALAAATANLAAWLRRRPEPRLADVAYTLQTGRAAFAWRRTLVASDLAAAAAGLAEPRAGDSCESLPRRPAVAFLFPGQGAQHLGMGAELYALQPAFRTEVDRCSELLRPRLGVDLRALLAGARPAGETAERLAETAIAQPALFVVEYALARLWLDWGVEPRAMLGHSLGELVAACLAGVMSLEDALALVAVRGALMQATAPGAMAAVPLGEAELLPRLDRDLALAAVNGRSRSVVSGPVEAVERFVERLAASGIACRALPASRAFHSSLMDAISEPFASACRKLRLAPPSIPFLSNVTGTWITPEEAVDPRYWARHLRATVRFADGVDELLREPDRVLLAVGPGRALDALVLRHRPETRQRLISSLPAAGERGAEEESLLRALGRLWSLGTEVRWERVHGGRRRHRVSLPTYPFERQRCWLDARAPLRAAESPAPVGAERQPVPPAVWPVGAPPPEAGSGGAEAESPRNDLRGALCELIGELLGSQLSAAHLEISLLEVGIDSLLLIQVSQAIRRRFGVKISLAEFLDQLTTIEAVAAHLERALSALAARDAAPWPAPPAAVPAAVAPPAAPPLAAREPFLPLQPVEIALGGELSQHQRRHLEELARRYLERTGESKRRTERHRPHLAENRASVGFRLSWKELIYPIVGRSSAAGRFIDVDGNEYVDLAMGFGVNLFGHGPEFIADAIAEQLRLGWQLGPQCELAGEVAERLCALTGLERAAFCNSGTEAVMTALRLARAVTGRARVCLFAGSYHGSFDGTLVRRAGDGGPQPLAPGVLPHMVEDLLVLDYGSPAALETLARRGGELAAILVEPVQSRRPDLQPREFLHALRRIADQTGAALIFDEMITGFRVHPGGAQAWFGVRADLATYGKVIGGGMPIGVVAGKAAYLDAIDGGAWTYGDGSYPRADKTFFAGTFCKHPLAMAAARAVLRRLETAGPRLQQQLNERTARLAGDLDERFRHARAPIRVARYGSLFRFEFEAEATWSDLFFFHLASKGVFVWEGRTCFLSTAHTEADLEQVLRAAAEAVAELQAGGFFVGAAASRSIPTTESQRGLWALAQTGPAACRAFNEGIALRLRGPLRLALLRGALQGLVDRHEALRATFSADGREQRIAPALRLAVPLIDVSALPPAAAERAVAAWLAGEVDGLFDLGSGPLVRAGVARLGERHHLAHLALHHLVADGWSFGVLANELRSLYQAGCEGRPPRLPAAARYGDYVAWQQEQERSAAMSAAESFWLGQFADGVPVLELPTDLPRPAVSTYRGGRVTRGLAPGLAPAITALSAERRATLLMVHLAAASALLHCVTGRSDLVVGLNSAQQPALGGDPLVGYCLNLLALRSRFAGDPTFVEHLAATKRLVLAAYEHQLYPFPRLVKKLKLRRHPGQSPLVAACFMYERSGAWTAAGGLEAEIKVNLNSSSRFDLTWQVYEHPGEIEVTCDFSRDLLAAATVERWLLCYERILAAVTARPDIRLGMLRELLDETVQGDPGASREQARSENLSRLRAVRRTAVRGRA